MTSSTVTNVAPWSMTGSIATIELAAGRGRLDVAHADRGLLIPDASGGHDALLGVDLAPLVEHWLRGSDVIAVFEPHDARRLRSTAMWRAHGRCADVESWEVIVSAQTALLETDVSVTVRADVAADALLWSPGGAAARWESLPPHTEPPAAARAILARRGSSSCLVAVHPADARRIDAVLAAGRGAITCRLFASALEKGVLLRSRVLAAVGPAADDQAWAARAMEAFDASPPPLTT